VGIEDNLWPILLKNEPKIVEVFPEPKQEPLKAKVPDVKQGDTKKPDPPAFNSLEPLKEEKVKEPAKDVKKVTVKPKANVKNTGAKRGSKSKTGR
jgi:hypothetical protein